MATDCQTWAAHGEPLWEGWKQRNDVSLAKKHKFSPELNDVVAIWHGDVAKFGVDCVLCPAHQHAAYQGCLEAGFARTQPDLQTKVLKLEPSSNQDSFLPKFVVSFPPPKIAPPAKARTKKQAPEPEDDFPLAVRSQVRASLLEAFALARAEEVSTIAILPLHHCIGEQAREIMAHFLLRVVRTTLSTQQGFQRVVFVCVDEQTKLAYENAAPIYFPLEDLQPAKPQIAEPDTPPKQESPPAKMQENSFVADPVASAVASTPPLDDVDNDLLPSDLEDDAESDDASNQDADPPAVEETPPPADTNAANTDQGATEAPPQQQASDHEPSNPPTPKSDASDGDEPPPNEPSSQVDNDPAPEPNTTTDEPPPPQEAPAPAESIQAASRKSASKERRKRKPKTANTNTKDAPAQQTRIRYCPVCMESGCLGYHGLTRDELIRFLKKI